MYSVNESICQKLSNFPISHCLCAILKFDAKDYCDAVTFDIIGDPITLLKKPLSVKSVAYIYVCVHLLPLT